MRKKLYGLSILALLLSGCQTAEVAVKTDPLTQQKYCVINRYPFAVKPKSLSAHNGITFRKMPDNRLAAYIIFEHINGSTSVPHKKPQILIKTMKGGMVEEQLTSGYVLGALDGMINEAMKRSPNATLEDEQSIYNRNSPIQGKDIWGVNVYYRFIGEKAYAFEVPLATFDKMIKSEKTQIIVQTVSDPFVFELAKDENKLLYQFRQML